ncbi:MAG: bifunctional metallophosphatase/5'-nucleotidase [Chitinophagaceae bacterium]
MNRHEFLRQTLLGTGAFALAQTPIESLAKPFEEHTRQRRITLLHTNDVHSRLDPFPNDGSKMAGKGGAAARYRQIEQIRKEGNPVLLLDAGDIFQGTPYFNFYKGKPEMQVMSLMGYDAATLGNHDFDLGMENLLHQMQYADFPFVNCNYELYNTPLENQVVPYHILHKGGIKIGIIGVGIDLEGLVHNDMRKGLVYTDPIQKANEMAYFLKKKKRCDTVICLSHLGFEYSSDKVSDKRLAAESEHIDWIIGGHTHTFLEQPLTIKNRKKQDVVINQVGWGGVYLGRIDIFFNHKKESVYVSKNQAVRSTETSI